MVTFVCPELYVVPLPAELVFQLQVYPFLEIVAKFAVPLPFQWAVTL